MERNMVTGKHVLRALREARTEQSVGEATRIITAAIKQAEVELAAAERTALNASVTVAELLSSVKQLQVDAAVSLDHLMDNLGRSGTDPRAEALDNVQDFLADAETELSDAHEALGREGRIKKTGRGVTDLTAALAKSSLASIRKQARAVMKELNKAEPRAERAARDLENAAADLDNGEVYTKFERKFEKLSYDLDGLVADFRGASDRLESV